MAATKKSRGKSAGTRAARVSARLLAIRALKEWSQSKAAEAIGISAVSLRKLETGEWQKLADPHEMLVAAADAYGTSLDHIFGRSDSAIERFASATPEVQSAQLSAITSGLARIAQSRETLQFVDELVMLLANELPDWLSLLSFRNVPPAERVTMLQGLAEAAGRLVQDRSAIKSLGEIVLRYARKSDSETPQYTSSIERDEASLNSRVSALERMFGRAGPADSAALTPSRFNVVEAGSRTTRRRSTAKSSRAARKK